MTIQKYIDEVLDQVKSDEKDFLKEVKQDHAKDELTLLKDM